MPGRPVRVVHVIGRIDVGGIQKAVLALIRELPSFSHTVIFTHPETGAMYPEYAAAAETIHCPYPPRGTAGFLLRLTRLLRKLAPDVVVAHLFGNHTLVSWAAFLAGVPATFGVSNNDPTWNPFSRSHVSRWKPRLLAHAARPFCRGEIAVSHTVGRVLTSVLRLPPRRIHVVTNGCAVDAIAARANEARSTKPRGGRPPRLLMIGAMVLSKDHPTLFQAIDLLRRQGRPVELWLAGDGYRRAEREAIVDRLGIRDLVKFLGARDDIPQLLGAVDALVHATISEGFGLVLIEAMAAGTPVIATGIPACREVLDEGRCGLLVPPRDADALARAIGQILDDADLRGRLIAAASERVRTLYDVKHTAAGYEKLLRPGASPAS